MYAPLFFFLVCIAAQVAGKTQDECEEQLFRNVFSQATSQQDVTDLGRDVNALRSMLDEFSACQMEASDSNPEAKSVRTIHQAREVLLCPPFFFGVQLKHKRCVDATHEHQQYQRCTESYRRALTNIVQGTSNIDFTFCAMTKVVDLYFGCVTSAYNEVCSEEEIAAAITPYVAGMRLLIRARCDTCEAAKCGCEADAGIGLDECACRV